VKCWFDKGLVSNKYFQVGDLFVKWEKGNEPKGKHTKFQHLWLGPFQIEERVGSRTFKLGTLEGEIEELCINAQIPKKYFSR
jgi:hypothetical protein